MGVLAMLLVSPFITLAEEAAVTGSGSAEVTTGTTATPPAAGIQIDSWSLGASNPQMPPSTSGSGMVAPRDPATGQSSGKRQHQPVMVRKEMAGASSTRAEGVKAPRDVATGQSSGRMMASGTKPLLPKMEERMEKRDQKMASGTERMEEKMEERKEKMEERRGEIIKRMATHMATKMQAAIERFTKIADRLDSRVAKLKEKGVVTTTAEANIAIARTKISEATVSLSLAKSQIGTIAVSASTTDPATGGVGGAVRESMQKARVALEAAHKALVEAIKSLRSNDKLEVSTSASTTVSQ